MQELRRMSFGDRLGIAGLIVACIGIGITILWPSVRWVGWGAIAIAACLCLYWAISEFKRPLPTPSLLFVFGVPLGDNDSPLWMMMLKHFGPNSAHNCSVSFYDKDRINIEHLWLVEHPNSPYPPAALAGQTHVHLHVPEAGPSGAIPNSSFQWRPVDPDRQHYTASISCRDGVFAQTWDVTRVDGVLRSRVRIEHGPDWVEKHPKANPIVFECTDPEFVEVPLATAIAPAQPAPHPGWKPTHVFTVPVAIIDPNGNLQIVSGVKQPDGSTKTDFGCWNILTRHFGDDDSRPRKKRSV